MEIEITGFVDKDFEKQKSGLLNKPVLSPDAIRKENDMIVISSMYGSEIEDELKVRGLMPKVDFVHDNLI